VQNERLQQPKEQRALCSDVLFKGEAPESKVLLVAEQLPLDGAADAKVVEVDDKGGEQAGGVRDADVKNRECGGERDGVEDGNKEFGKERGGGEVGETGGGGPEKIFVGHEDGAGSS
jgi:hypothetical protein